MSQTDTPSPAKKLRTFIALSPPAAWEQELAAGQKALQKSISGGDIKWVQPNCIHLTLRFLGYIQPSDVVPVSERLSATAKTVRSFELTATELGCFPNCRNPRVLWAGLSGDLAALEKLHAAVVEATDKYGEPPEDRPFKPHLTIARIKHFSRENARALEARLPKTALKFPPWQISEVVLYQSHLSSAGPRYEALGRFHFAA
jgi:RNA 2',3'-cyclic 3'-phosphodiesterase